MHERFAPGDWGRHPTETDWGLGQVQSVVGDRLTANFENVGKQLINIAVIGLVRIPSPTRAERDSERR